jgi:hypothetical protein
MSKRNLSIFSVQTNDWMKYRPYERFSPSYDGFYLRLSNSIFEVLNSPMYPLRSELNRTDIVDLSVVLTSWFEDYTNEIGLWAAFVRQNKAQHGFWLPFFPLDDYDPEEINTEDIVYLIWHYCCKASEKFVSPNNPGLQEMAEEVIDLFDAALDEAPGTDFYEEYLNISHDTYFFDIKNKLEWIAFKNYLIAPEFVRNLNVQIKELSENKRNLSYIEPQKLIYTLQDDYFYRKRSSFLAFSCPEWLAEMARYPDTLRTDILNLSKRVMGEFIYEKNEDSCYHFRQSYTKRLFNVHKKSVTIKKGINEGELVLTNIVEWQGAWWVTGTLMGLGSTPSNNSKKPIDPSRVPFYGWSEEQQQRICQVTANMEAAHLDYYGTNLVFFKNKNDLNTVLQGQNNHYNELTKKGKSSQKPPTNLIFTSPSTAGKRSMSISFEPGVGSLISLILAQVAYALDQPSLAKDEADDLFFDFFSECSPAIAKHLIERFSARNLRWPVPVEAPIETHLSYLSRFYNPAAFGEPIPNNTLIL